MARGGQGGSAEIRRLPEAVAGKIAAGEVVERPAAALKELVENSLDAGARRISVEIAGGGLDLLAVHDDGAGIAADQLATAFERHATSKLSTAEELWSVASYGFRGEALPAIAAAAGSLIAESRAAGESTGARIEFASGSLVDSGPVGRAPGTSISARGLFDPLPARRAFLPSTRSERTALLRVCTDAALARPDAAIRVTIDGREAFVHDGGAEADAAALQEAFGAVFGRDAAGRAWPFAASAETEVGVLELDGIAGAPEDHRRARDGLRLFIDGRPVQDRALAWSMQEAYRDWLPPGRFPIVVARLRAPTGSVDVNVHPAKARVDLRGADLAASLLRRTLRETLAERRANAPMRLRRASSGLDYSEDALPAGRLSTPPESSWRGAGSSLPGPRASLPSGGRASPDEAEGDERVPGLRPLRMVGQLHRTFIIAEGAEGLILVDQHGAHERVLYERLLAGSSELGEAGAQQPLLEPITIEPGAEAAAAYEDAAGELERLGFAIRPFGPLALRLSALPAAVEIADAERLVLDVLEKVAGATAPPQRFERAAATAACHGAVRRGHPLDAPAMTRILRDLERCDNPHSCPHGRPTMLEFSADDLLRQFRRK